MEEEVDCCLASHWHLMGMILQLQATHGKCQILQSEDQPKLSSVHLLYPSDEA